MKTKIKTGDAADGVPTNHHEAVEHEACRYPRSNEGLRGRAQGLKVQTHIRAGEDGFFDPMWQNHNETLVRIADN